MFDMRIMAPFTVKFIFFFLNFLVYFNFMMVARKWPQYVNHWENAERKFMELQILQYQNLKLKRRIQKIFVLVTLVAFSEYLKVPITFKRFLVSDKYRCSSEKASLLKKLLSDSKVFLVLQPTL
jgi:hypothetical protein